MNMRIYDFYRELNVEKKMCILKLKMLEDKKTYYTTLINFDKKQRVIDDIKILKKYYKSLEETTNLFIDKIKTMVYIDASELERAVFIDSFVRELPIDEVFERNKDKAASKQTIYNIISKINKELDRVKVNDEYVNKVLRRVEEGEFD